MIRKANLKQEGFKVMGEIIIPQGYKSALNLHDTQVAIKTVKDYFQHELSTSSASAPCNSSTFCTAGNRLE